MRDRRGAAPTERNDPMDINAVIQLLILVIESIRLGLEVRGKRK